MTAGPARSPQRKARTKTKVEKAGQAHAFGETFIIAPTFSMRMHAEDFVLLKAFTKHAGLAFLVHSEAQPTARLVELIDAESRQGVGPADALCACDLLGISANRVLSVPNAGGASRVSEAMSAEVLARAFGARLLQTELEIKYWPNNGSITDFSIELDDVVLGVSVTRAISAPGAPYTTAKAEALLRKKLSGILRSTASACGAWAKQILHVWAPTAAAANTIEAAYAALEPALSADTVVLVTVWEGLSALFEEKASSLPKQATRVAKGLKDENHLRMLAQSDPLRPTIVLAMTAV